jgi:hypothetical protein
MVQIILNAIYREFLRSGFPGIGGEAPMTVLATFLLLFSIGVFAVHALEAYRERSV